MGLCFKGEGFAGHINLPVYNTDEVLQSHRTKSDHQRIKYWSIPVFRCCRNEIKKLLYTIEVVFLTMSTGIK